MTRTKSLRGQEASRDAHNVKSAGSNPAAATTLDNSPIANPVRFALQILDVDLHKWQARVLMSAGQVGMRRKIAVRAPNGAGKDDRVIAPIALWWIRRFAQGTVVITSKDAKQLHNQTWRSLMAHKSAFTDCQWRDSTYSIVTPTGGQIIGFTTDESTRAEGYHRISDLKGPLLMIINEAKSVPDDIFDAFERCTYNVLLEISTGGPKSGRFYEHFTSQRDACIEHHVIPELGTIESLKEYCPHIPDEKIRTTIADYGIDDPLTRSALFGEFMESDASTRHVFELADIEHNRASIIDYIGGPTVVGCDFAAGGNENVICIRKGNKVDAIVSWRDKNTMAAVGRFIWEFSSRNLRPEWIWGDAEAIEMLDRMREAKWPINRFNFGGKSPDARFKNAGSYIWHMSAANIKTNRIIFPRGDEPSTRTLIAQLTNRYFKFDSLGKLWMEQKHEMAARGIDSPDIGDAFCMAFGVQPVQSTTWIEQEDRFSEIAARHGWDYTSSEESGRGRGREDEALERMGLGSW